MTAWQDHPFVFEVKAGETKAFCICGLSSTGPFCDGSHAGSGTMPDVVTFDEDKTIAVCGCRKSANLPYCDGSHKAKPD